MLRLSISDEIEIAVQVNGKLRPEVDEIWREEEFWEIGSFSRKCA